MAFWVAVLWHSSCAPWLSGVQVSIHCENPGNTFGHCRVGLPAHDSKTVSVSTGQCRFCRVYVLWRIDIYALAPHQRFRDQGIKCRGSKMKSQTFEASPQVYARIGGILYLLIIVAGALGEIFIRGTVIVSGDAVSTAHKIMASQSLWRIGITGDLLMHVFDIPLMLVFYVLLKPV